MVSADDIARAENDDEKMECSFRSNAFAGWSQIKEMADVLYPSLKGKNSVLIFRFLVARWVKNHFKIITDVNLKIIKSGIYLKKDRSATLVFEKSVIDLFSSMIKANFDLIVFIRSRIQDDFNAIQLEYDKHIEKLETEERKNRLSSPEPDLITTDEWEERQRTVAI